MDRRELWRRIAGRSRATRFEEIDQLLRLAGWELHHVPGSHYVYRTARGHAFRYRGIKEKSRSYT